MVGYAVQALQAAKHKAKQAAIHQQALKEQQQVGRVACLAHTLVLASSASEVLMLCWICQVAPAQQLYLNETVLHQACYATSAIPQLCVMV